MRLTSSSRIGSRILSRNHLSVLGDYGTGKSSFCLQLTYKLAKRYIEDPVSHRIPVFISLRDYATAVSVQQLVTDLLLNKYSINLPNYAVFEKVLESGKLVLILDGFDEMATRVDKRVTLRNFEELCRLVVPNSKTILTCRTHYFKSHTHALDLLSQSEQTELMKSVIKRPNFEIMELLEFDDSQIQQLLRLRTDKWEEYWRHIQRTWNLEDLARRPILLDMIIKTLPELVAAGREADAARLYYEYTQFWIEREDWHSVMTKRGKAVFMEELANLMYSNEGKEWIGYRDLPRPIKEHFRQQIVTSEDLDYYDHDTRACSFLNRDREGNYKFIHRPFMEFFVAKRLVRHLEDGRSIGIRDTMLPPVIAGFVEKLLSRRDRLWGMIETTRGKRFQQTRYIGGNAVSLLKRMGESLAGTDLSRTVLRNADLSGANLEAADLRGADLREVALDYALVAGANLQGADLEGATFSDSVAVHSLGIDSDGKRIAVGGSMGNIGIFRIADGHLDQNLKFPTGSVKLCFNPIGTCLAIGDNEGKLLVIDLRTRAELLSNDAHEGAIADVAFSPNGQMVALVSEDHRGSIWDVRTRQRVFEILGHTRCLNVVSYSPDGKILASGGDDKCVKIWDPDTGELKRSIRLDHTCWAICFSEDSAILFAAGGSNQRGCFPVSACDYDKGVLFASVPVHQQVIYAMRSLPRDDGVVTFSQDGSIKTWRLGTKQPRLLRETGQSLWAGDFSLVNEVIAAGDSHGSLLGLRLSDGEIVCDINTTVTYQRMDIRGAKGVADETTQFLMSRGAVCDASS